MIKLSRKLEYSLIAIKHMSQKPAGTLTSAKELTLVYGVPFDVVSRVLQLLTQVEVAKSIQGVHGGYLLNKKLDEITLMNLIDYVEGPLHLVKCLSEDETCELKSLCNIAGPVGALNEKLKHFYSSLKLSEILINESALPSTHSAESHL